MSEVIEKAVAALTEKMGGTAFDGCVKFEIEDVGSIIVDGDGVRAGDDEADCTLTASVETFEGIMDGSTNPTAAFMTGQLSVDGDMGQAMKLGAILG